VCYAQDLLRKAGVEGVAVCAFLEDHHLVDPSFLEYINSLLSSGEVPGLFAPEELEKELKSLDAVKAEAGAQDVTNYHFFVQRVQQVVLAVRQAPENSINLYVLDCQSY
jgi:dynein heavy chain 2